MCLLLILTSNNIPPVLLLTVLFHSAQLKAGGMFMLATAVSYIIIQGSAFAHRDLSGSSLAYNEHWFALFGFISCLFFFFAYLVGVGKGE